MSPWYEKRIVQFLSSESRPLGLLMAAGVIACLATLLGFFGRSSWFLDLFSHFRVQYLIGLAVIGTLFLVGRRRKTAILLLGFACVNLMFVLPLYFGSKSTLPEDVPTLRAMLLNVNTRLGDAVRVRHAIIDADPDILALEEISDQWIEDLDWITNSYPYSLAMPREDNFGIGLFSKLPFADSEITYIGSANVPSILATVSTEQKNVRVVVTHPLPPGGREYSRWRNQQLELLPNCITPGETTLLLGDLNVTPWNHYFRRLLSRTGLMDSSKGMGVHPTWPSNNPLLLIPIDHCLHSKDIVIVDKRIGTDVSSDHYPVIVDFAIVAEPD